MIHFLIVYALDLQKQSKTCNLMNSPQMKSIMPSRTHTRYIVCSIGMFLLGIAIMIIGITYAPHALEFLGIHG